MRVKMGVEDRQVLVATSRTDTSMPSGARDRRVPTVRAGPVYLTTVPGDRTSNIERQLRAHAGILLRCSLPCSGYTNISANTGRIMEDWLCGIGPGTLLLQAVRVHPSWFPLR